MRPLPLPSRIIWDTSYACPLRCLHCYSESGRRASELPSAAFVRAFGDRLLALRPAGVLFSGGEPLLMPELLPTAQRLRDAGIETSLFTTGYGLTAAGLPELLRAFSELHLSLDGATAAVHDAVRGRPGSFERLHAGLALLEAHAGAGERVQFGVDTVLVQSNFPQIEQLVSDLAARYPHLAFINLGAAIPSGLGNRASVAELELLSDRQLARLRDPAFAATVTARAPGVRVSLQDNWDLMMDPEQIARGTACTGAIQIEPDGAVRAAPIYEGTIGNFLTEPLEVLWRRAQDRWNEPAFRDPLRGARSLREWAAAARRIDAAYASPAGLVRLAARPELPGAPRSA